MEYLPESVTPEMYPFTGKHLTVRDGLRLHYLCLLYTSDAADE